MKLNFPSAFLYLIVASLLLPLQLYAAVIGGDLTRTSRDGNVELTVRLSDQQVQVAEPIVLEFELVAPPGTAVRFPEFGEQLGNWDIVHLERLEDVPVEGGGPLHRGVVVDPVEPSLVRAGGGCHR